MAGNPSALLHLGWCRDLPRRNICADGGSDLDDGPTKLGVDYATAVLGQLGVKGTFFLTNREAQARPQLVRRLLEAGHEVGNHSYSHQRMVLETSGFYEREITRTAAIFERAGVSGPRLFRPPYGKKLVGLPLAVERHGYRMVMWDIEEPELQASARAYADQIVSEARPGSIILMHIMYAGNASARAALPLVVRGLQAPGFRIVRVGELIHLRR